MKRLSDTQCFDKLTNSECYKNTVNDADKKKVTKARAGTNPTTPSSLIAQVAAELGLRAHAAEGPPPPPPPPPPKGIGVAPRATNMEGGANVQYVMRDENGNLYPGVQDLGGDNFRDESGATYHESLQTSGIRDETYRVDPSTGFNPGLPGSRGMDGRSPLQCFIDAGKPGDPAKNTGAYHI